MFGTPADVGYWGDAAYASTAAPAYQFVNQHIPYTDVSAQHMPQHVRYGDVSSDMPSHGMQMVVPTMPQHAQYVPSTYPAVGEMAWGIPAPSAYNTAMHSEMYPYDGSGPMYVTASMMGSVPMMHTHPSLALAGVQTLPSGAQVSPSIGHQRTGEGCEAHPSPLPYSAFAMGAMSPQMAIGRPLEHMEHAGAASYAMVGRGVDHATATAYGMRGVENPYAALAMQQRGMEQHMDHSSTASHTYAQMGMPRGMEHMDPSAGYVMTAMMTPQGLMPVLLGPGGAYIPSNAAAALGMEDNRVRQQEYATENGQVAEEQAGEEEYVVAGAEPEPEPVPEPTPAPAPATTATATTTTPHKSPSKATRTPLPPLQTFHASSPDTVAKPAAGSASPGGKPRDMTAGSAGQQQQQQGKGPHRKTSGAEGTAPKVAADSGHGKAKPAVKEGADKSKDAKSHSAKAPSGKLTVTISSHSTDARVVSRQAAPAVVDAPAPKDSLPPAAGAEKVAVASPSKQLAGGAAADRKDKDPKGKKKEDKAVKSESTVPETKPAAEAVVDDPKTTKTAKPKVASPAPTPADVRIDSSPTSPYEFTITNVTASAQHLRMSSPLGLEKRKGAADSMVGLVYEIKGSASLDAEAPPTAPHAAASTPERLSGKSGHKGDKGSKPSSQKQASPDKKSTSSPATFKQTAAKGYEIVLPAGSPTSGAFATEADKADKTGDARPGSVIRTRQLEQALGAVRTQKPTGPAAPTPAAKASYIIYTGGAIEEAKVEDKTATVAAIASLAPSTGAARKQTKPPRGGKQAQAPSATSSPSHSTIASKPDASRKASVDSSISVGKLSQSSTGTWVLKL